MALSLIAATIGAVVFFGKTDHAGARRGEDVLRFHRYGERMNTTVFDFLEDGTPSVEYTVEGRPPGLLDSTVQVYVSVSSGPHTGRYTFIVDPKGKTVDAADETTRALVGLVQTWADARRIRSTKSMESHSPPE